MTYGLSVYPSDAVVERDKVDKELGYVHIWLPNEGNVQQDIYFDELKIIHEKSRVVQMDD